MTKKNKIKLALLTLFFLGVGFLLYWLIKDGTIAILEPKGIIAQKEYDLLVTATLLMLIIVIPVFILTFYIVWKYRETNPKAKYTPEWDSSRLLESIWWGVPMALILVLAVMTWNSSHELDPFKPLDSKVKPITIQVVALQWKWLFIYPEQNIATVNYVSFPVDTPVNFKITSDSPMNSFWIPQLGGQIYAMGGMDTKLHLIANEVGIFNGLSSNISGKGFASMTFKAQSLKMPDFETWVKSVKRSPQNLTKHEYSQLARPSENVAPLFYKSAEPNLYDTIIKKYMGPDHMHAEGKE